MQRLQEITEEDAEAEGVEAFDGMYDAADLCRYAKLAGCSYEDARAWFAWAWDHINGNRRRREHLTVGDPGYTIDKPWRTVIDTSATWAANPWVWAISFKRAEDPR